jgi:hypothetical protein
MKLNEVQKIPFLPGNIKTGSGVPAGILFF